MIPGGPPHPPDTRIGLKPQFWDKCPKGKALPGSRDRIDKEGYRLQPE